MKRRGNTWFGRALLALALLLAGGAAGAQTTAETDTAQGLLQQLNDYPHSRTINLAEQEVLDYEIGLGAIQKISGAWRFKHSERFSGSLTSYSWQIMDGFTSIEVMDELEGRVGQLADAQLLFSCDGRACGQGVQWANRVFHQPVLYGREELQRYRVYRTGDDPQSLLVIYASARTADRQYLHAETLRITP